MFAEVTIYHMVFSSIFHQLTYLNNHVMKIGSWRHCNTWCLDFFPSAMATTGKFWVWHYLLKNMIKYSYRWYLENWLEAGNLPGVYLSPAEKCLWLSPGVSSVDVETRSDSVCTCLFVRREPIRAADKLDEDQGREKGIQDFSKVVGLSSEAGLWTEVGKTGFKRTQEFGSGHAELEETDIK